MLLFYWALFLNNCAPFVVNLCLHHCLGLEDLPFLCVFGYHRSGSVIESVLQRHQKTQQQLAEDMINIARTLRTRFKAAWNIIQNDQKVQQPLTLLHGRQNRSGRSGHGPTKLFAKPTFILLDLSLFMQLCAHVREFRSFA